MSSIFCATKWLLIYSSFKLWVWTLKIYICTSGLLAVENNTNNKEKCWKCAKYTNVTAGLLCKMIRKNFFIAFFEVSSVYLKSKVNIIRNLGGWIIHQLNHLLHGGQNVLYHLLVCWCVNTWKGRSLVQQGLKLMVSLSSFSVGVFYLFFLHVLFV